MKWDLGNWSAYPEDGRCFIERIDHNSVDSDEQEWFIFRTDDDGRVMEGFPKLCEKAFPTLEAAKSWAEEHLS